MLLYELLDGKTPFDDESPARVQAKIARSSEAVLWPEDMAAEARTFLERLLVRDPAARLGAGRTGTADVSGCTPSMGAAYRTIYWPRAPTS